MMTAMSMVMAMMMPSVAVVGDISMAMLLQGCP